MRHGLWRASYLSYFGRKCIQNLHNPHINNVETMIPFSLVIELKHKVLQQHDTLTQPI